VIINKEKKNKQADYSISSYDIAIKIFREYIRPEIKRIAIAMVCLLTIAFTTAINAWLIQPVLDNVFMQKKTELLFFIPFCVFINSLVKSLAEFYQNSSMKIIGQKIVSSIQKELYEHLIYSDLKLFHDHSSGKLLSKFTNEVNMMKRSIIEVCKNTVRDFVTLIALISLMFYQSIAMSLIFILVIPMIFLPVIQLGRRMRKTANKIQDELASYSTRLDETFKNITIIKSYCNEKYELEKAGKVLNDIEGSYRKSIYIESSASPLMEVVSGITIALAIWYGGTCIIAQTLTPGEFFSFITALLMCYRPLKAVSELNNTLQEGFSAAHRLFSLMAQKPVIQESPEAQDIKFKKYDIEFKGVSFSYKKCKAGVLKNFNMVIGNGQTVALVGTSGVGKSTILQLLQRFYDPDSGKIFIDGHQITDMRLTQLRSSIGFVSQDVAIFDETIDYNIRYGRMDATDAEVIEAAKAAAAHEFIVEMPDGYNTHIGQAGLRISGGQKQRIAIARALLKNSPILLLDEATSALDSISEAKVQQALNNLKKGRTTIIIAHRLSTIETADLIYVVSDGKASEFGTHKELLNKSERYSKLYSYYKDSVKIKK
jgi:subfamily B ATP-binding cassette protein MsbA